LINNYDSVVNSFYLAYYGRPADTAGLAYWTQQLDSAGGDFGTIANAFATSAEGVVRFGGDNAAERIATIYQQLFNRAPDAAGLQYWTEAVESGRTTLAAVTMDILKGAQGSDVTISALRAQAAADFTATVASSGLDYDGYASIEAARTLVAAVTAGTTQDQLTTMVKAAVKLADVAHDTPAVVEALGAGGKLVPLFATARGQAEPANLLQALADLGKTAAGDPATLESLLRGGSMNKVLEVMPSSATLHDVVDALGSGGLAAAVEVVYPTPPVQTAPVPAPIPVPTPAEPLPTPAEPLPTPSEPAPTPAEPLPLPTPAEPLPTPSEPLPTPAEPLPTPSEPLPAPSEPAPTPAEPLPTPSEPLPAPSEPLPTPAEPLPTPAEPLPTPAEPLPVIDPPAQTFTFTTISQGEGESASVAGTADPLATNLPMAVVNALMSAQLQPRQQIQYSLDKGVTWEVRDAYSIGDKVWIENVPTTDHASLMLRVVDLDTGLAGKAATQAIVYDGEAPVVGSLVFIKVSEGVRDTQHDNVTNVALATATLRIDGAQPAAGEQLQYSLDGAQWTGSGLQLDPETGRITIDNLDLAQGAPNSDGNRVTTLQLRAIDAAGNATVVGSQDLVYDNSATAPVVVLAKDTGISATDKLTYSGDVRVSGLDSGSAWEYAFDGGDLVKGEGAVDGKATLSLSGDGAHSVLVRLYDAAGNVNRTRLDFTLDTTKPAALPAFDHVEGATTVANATGLATADVVFKYEGGFDAGDFVEYRTDIGGWTRSDSILVDQGAHTITLPDVDLSTSDPFIAVRVVDTAGNQGVEAGATVNGPFGHIDFSTQVRPDGLAVTSSGDATLYLQTASNSLIPLLSTAGGGAVGGTTVVVGAQSAISTGTLVLKSASGEMFADPSGTVYSFGTPGPAKDTFVAPGSVLWGFGGSNEATAGNAGVRFFGGAGINKLTGGAGDDVLIGGTGPNSLIGGAGNDYLVGGPATGLGSNTLEGGAGNDTLEAGTGTAGILGGTGADTIILTKGKNTLMFNEGDSSIANGIDTVIFADTLAGNTSNQLFRFTASSNDLYRASNVANPVDGSNAGLLSAFAGVYQAKAGQAPYASVLVEFANHDKYLILDTGDGIFDVNDHVIKLVGAIPDASAAPVGITFSPTAV